MGDRTKVGHLDLSLFLGGEELHDRRLNQGHQGHVGVSCYGYSTPKVRSQFRSQVNGGRAISATDDTDGSCFLHIEAQEHSAGQCYEYADLGSCTQKHGLRVSDEGTKVGHGTYAHENQRRENFVFNTKSNSHHNAHIGFKTGIREVSHNIAKSDRHQQKRFVFFCDCQIEQDKSYQNHNDVFDGEGGKAGVSPYGNESSHKAIHNCILLILMVMFYLFLLVFGWIHNVNQLNNESKENQNSKYDNHVSDTNGKWARSIHL